MKKEEKVFNIKGEIEMAVSPMQRKSRNSFLLGMLITLLLAGGVIGFLIYQMGQLQNTLAVKEGKTGYVLTADLKSGEAINPASLKPVKLEYVPSNPLTLADVSDHVLKTKTALTKGVVLSADMVYIDGQETKKDTRVQEYNMITLPSKLENGDYIDIRITLPTGQDYIVASKKQILACDTTTIWIEVSEDEIMMLNNAIVEAYVMKGANFYATVYQEAGLQEAAKPTYAMSTSVFETFQKNPNLLQEAISEYNSKSTDAEQANRQSIEKALSQYTADKKQNIEDGVEATKGRQAESRLKYISELDATY